jgi:hypothetical protein
MVISLSICGNVSIQHTSWPLIYIKTCPLLEVPQQDVDADQMVTTGVVVTTIVTRDPLCNARVMQM